MLLGPLAKFLRGLLFVLPHFVEESGVNLVQVHPFRILSRSDAFDVVNQKARATAWHFLHLRIGPSLDNHLLHSAEPVAKGGHAILDNGDSVPSNPLANFGLMGVNAGGEFGSAFPFTYACSTNPELFRDLKVRKFILCKQ